MLELLAPKPGERILDVGCGDGVLTKKIADMGCEVVAVDSSTAFIESARKLGLDAHVVDAVALPYCEEFDAVFSNAVLHWIKRADEMIAGVHRSLRPGGRFVAECGGFGCVDKIRRALVAALDKRGINGEARVPWYFPTPGDYATRHERAGFRVDSLALIPHAQLPCLETLRVFLKLLGFAFLRACLARIAANIFRTCGPFWSPSS